MTPLKLNKITPLLPNEGYDSGLVILALSMFQTEVSNLETRNKLELLCRGHLIQLGQDLASVRGEGHQHREVGQGHQGHVVLGIGAGLGMGDQVHRILDWRERLMATRYVT